MIRLVIALALLYLAAGIDESAAQGAGNLFGPSCPNSLRLGTSFANTSGGTTATTLNVADGGQCVPYANLNRTDHWVSWTGRLFENISQSPTSVNTSLVVGTFYQNLITNPVVVNGEFDHMRVSQASGGYNQYTIGASSLVSGYMFQMEELSGSNASANMYGAIGNVVNDGPGSAKGIYGRATSAPGSTGTVVGLVSGITTSSTTSNAYGLEISGDTFTNSSAVPLNAYIWLGSNSNSGVTKAMYGVLLDQYVNIQAGGAGVHMIANGSGDFLSLVNSALTADIFHVTAAGNLGVGVANGAFGVAENLSVKGFGLIGTPSGVTSVIGDTGTGSVVLGGFSNHPIDFRQNNRTAFTVDTSDNVTFAGNVNTTLSGNLNRVPGILRACAVNVNFNAGNTDVSITLNSPTTRWVPQAVRVGNATVSLSTATVGLFTALSGGGQTIAATQTITVTATAPDTINNSQALAITNGNVEAYNDTTVQVHVGNPEGTAANGDVCMWFWPM